MANAMIFRRTLTTRKVDVGFETPNLLPAPQKLLFTPPNDLARRLLDEYTNNIVRQTPPKPSGRRINQRDQGVAGWLMTIEGDFVKGTGDSDTKIHDFRKIAQADTYHQQGVFGMQYPSGPAWAQSLDPDNTRGLMIVSTRGVHVSITKELVDFSITFSYGGDVV